CVFRRLIATNARLSKRFINRVSGQKKVTHYNMDFAVSCPLVRHWRLISGFCSSTRTFDPCFLQTPPRGGSPCIITRPSPPSGWPEDFHLQTTEHARHTTKPLVRRTLRVRGLKSD